MPLADKPSNDSSTEASLMLMLLHVELDVLQTRNAESSESSLLDSFKSEASTNSLLKHAHKWNCWLDEWLAGGRRPSSGNFPATLCKCALVEFSVMLVDKYLNATGFNHALETTKVPKQRRRQSTQTCK